MNHARVRQEILPSQRISQKELMGQHVPFQSIAWAACDDEVAGRGRSASRHGVDVIDRREFEVESGAAVDAAAAAVAHHRPFQGALGFPPEDLPDLALQAARRAWEWDAGSAMSGHCTSPKRSDAQRRGFPVLGVADRAEKAERALRARRLGGRTSELSCVGRRRNERLMDSRLVDSAKVTPPGRHASHHCIGAREAQEARAALPVPSPR